MTKSLYDRDFLLWIEDTVTKLKARDFEHLDLENLIEEVESLGRSERRELLSRLTTLVEHLIKRLYVPIPNDYNGWERTIREQRRQLRALLKDSPSLMSTWSEFFPEAWDAARNDLCEEYKQVSFPDRWPYASDIESILNLDFWEEQP